eukprot:scaffold3434_cov70-Cylindrotheca_fusiformis.AAC.1
MKVGKQHTIRFHVDDTMASHVNSKVNDKFENWLNRKYGSVGEKEDKKPLDKKRAEEFHGVVAKGVFLAKRARGDIHQVISVLCSRVRDPDEKEWGKLFTPEFRSHTGAVMTWGDGGVQTISRRQKLNTRSSTEAELVGVDDVATHILWTKLFLEKQGYQIEKNILFQDNQSAILLETNGRKTSAGQRSRALNVRYFFIADQVEKGNVVVKHCPTDEMVGDYMTKPLQGSKFREFRRKILGEKLQLRNNQQTKHY